MEPEGVSAFCQFVWLSDVMSLSGHQKRTDVADSNVPPSLSFVTN